jgi:ferric-dicitrate binding protein FerR (iron transport regulator)
MADATRIAQLIIKRLQGNITAWQEMELDAWINSSPENKAFVEENLRTEELAEDLLIQAEMDEEYLDTVVWRSIEEALVKAKKNPPPQPRPQPQPQPRRQNKALWIGVAALAAAAILFLFIRTTLAPA